MRIPQSAPIVAFVLLALASPLRAGPSEPLHQLFQEWYDWWMAEFPKEAMSLGDYTNAHRLTDHSIEAIGRRHRATVAYRERLEAIPVRGLEANDRISRELFDRRLRNDIAAYRFRSFVMPIGQREGPHRAIPLMAEGVRFDAADDYENYMKRLEQVGTLVDQTIELMRLGLAEGRTPPRVALLGVPAQLSALLEEGGLAALEAPLERMPAHFTDAQRQTYPVKYEYEALPVVRDAIERLGRFFDEEYLPGCREAIAATALPDGEAYYAHQLRKMTTTGMTPRQIRQLGLAEVARIRAEMMDVIRASDYLELHPGHATLDDESLFRSFVTYLREDPRFYHEREEDLLAGYRDICKRVDAWLPRLFRTLPRLTYGVERIPDFIAPYQTTAYYQPGSLENAEPGYFYANTYALDQRPRYEMVALALHEAVPGHHLQYALALELEDVPAFRRDTWFNAFGEGWALYSERLGIEMGLYADPYDDFGRLLYEMWRACRLVVDPGIHAFGMSRDEAVAYMRENTALSRINIETEVDRYIAWPGQACGYKIGELKIRELRRTAEERLGARFDIRVFHDLVLGAGSLPLDVLERRVRRWIRSHPGGAAYD